MQSISIFVINHRRNALNSTPSNNSKSSSLHEMQQEPDFTRNLACTLIAGGFIVALKLDSILANGIADFFQRWSRTQQIAFAIGSSLVALCVIMKIKDFITQRRLRRQGFRRLDLSAQLCNISHEMGCSSTVSGFEVCSDSLTIAHLKEMARELMRSLINFRSQIHKIGNEWYYKETFDPETASMDDYVTTVSLALDDDYIHVSSDDEDETEERMLQRVVQWLNEHRAFNIKWTEYDRAHFDMIYFHFQSLGKCVFYFRFDHSLGDGILICSLVTLFQNHLYNPSIRIPQQSMDWTKSEDILRLIKAVRGDESQSLSLRPSMSTVARRTAYHYLHYPVAVFNFVYTNIAMAINPVPKCAFFGEFGDLNQMAIGQRIPIYAFKAVAHSNGGTVNDLFMALSLGSLRRYALKMKCPVFASDSYDGHCSKLGVASYRPLKLKRFAEEIREFAVEGTNANKIDLVPFRANIKKADVPSVQRAFHGVKYGANRNVMRSILSGLGSIPGGRRAQLEASRDIVLLTSNVQGPTRPIPIPTVWGDEDEDAVYDSVSTFFGMAVPGFLPINYTLVSYNGYIRVGLITNSGTIADPKVLMQSFMEEWKEYEKISLNLCNNNIAAFAS